MSTTFRIDPRTMESLNAQLKALREQLVNYPKGSAQRENCEEQIRMQEKQLRLVTAGQMGVAQ